jgi:hypothetical protein
MTTVVADVTMLGESAERATAAVRHARRTLAGA